MALIFPSVPGTAIFLPSRTRAEPISANNRATLPLNAPKNDELDEVYIISTCMTNRVSKMQIEGKHRIWTSSHKSQSETMSDHTSLEVANMFTLAFGDNSAT